RHIDAAMIRSHFHAGSDGRFDAAALDAALKSLYATGLFQDVTIARDGDRVLIKVVENPTIERMAFEGNKKIKDEDLKKAVQSKAGGPLARALVHERMASAHVRDRRRPALPPRPRGGLVAPQIRRCRRAQPLPTPAARRDLQCRRGEEERRGRNARACEKR